jgi:hypothetical protein
MVRRFRILTSIFLLIFAFPFLAAGGFEISGLMGAVNVTSAIAFSLAALAIAYSAGVIASPRTGKVGIVRSVAFVFFLVQSISFLVTLFGLIYGQIRHVEILESGQLLWGLVVGASALIFVLVSAKVWNLWVKT